MRSGSLDSGLQTLLVPAADHQLQTLIMFKVFTQFLLHTLDVARNPHEVNIENMCRFLPFLENTKVVTSNCIYSLITKD